MKKIFIYLAFASLVFLGCTDNFEELDKPKTTAAVIEPDYLFTRALVTGSGLSVGVWQLVHQTSGSGYAQHWANIKPGFTYDSYEPGPNNTVWEWYYSRAYFASLNLNHNARNLTIELENPIKESCVRIWQVYMYQLVTDMYGDIPYSAAFVESKPWFDNQKDIYVDMLKELKESAEILNLNKDKGYKGFAEADVLYQGDLDKWIKFANTLTLRIALRCSNVAETELTIPYLESLDLAQTIQSNDDMVKILPDKEGPTYHVKNPLKYVYGWDEVRLSKTMFDLLDVNNDPRLQIYAEPNEDGEYVGLENGQPQDELSLKYNDYYKPKFCNIGEFFIQDETPHYLLTYAEACFLKAEAAQKGYISGNAEDFYNEGIAASFEQFGISDAVVLTDYLNGTAKFNSSNVLQQIYEQRWIALYPNGNEAWNLVRRTGYPVMSTPLYTWPDNPEMPRRQQYPTSEKRYNVKNYDAATDRMGGDSQYVKVWWDGGN